MKLTVWPDSAGLGAAESVQSGASGLATAMVMVTGSKQSNVFELHPVNVYCTELPGVPGAVTWISGVWMLPGLQL